MSWKQKLIGTWAKIERKNFYDVRKCYVQFGYLIGYMALGAWLNMKDTLHFIVTNQKDGAAETSDEICGVSGKYCLRSFLAKYRRKAVPRASVRKNSDRPIRLQYRFSLDHHAAFHRVQRVANDANECCHYLSSQPPRTQMITSRLSVLIFDIQIVVKL